MKLGEFFIDLFVNASDGQLTVSKLVSSMGELEAVTLGEIGLLFEMGVQLASITDKAITTSLGLNVLTTTTGTSAEAIQRWQRIAEQVGLPAGVATGAVNALGEALGKIRVGQQTGATAGFMRLGLDPRDAQGNLKDVDTLLNQIAERIRTFKGRPEDKVNIIRDFGFDPSILVLFNKTLAERNAMAAEAHGLTQKEVDEFKEMHRAMTLIGQKVVQIGEDLADWAAPAIIESLEHAYKLLKAIEDKFNSGIFKGFGNMLWESQPAPVQGAVMAGKLGVNFLDQLLGVKPFFREEFSDLLPEIPSGISSMLRAPSLPPNQINKTYHTTVTVHESNDPEKTMDAVNRAIQSQNDQTDLLINP